jgi:hypothetical protein
VISLISKMKIIFLSFKKIETYSHVANYLFHKRAKNNVPILRIFGLQKNDKRLDISMYFKSTNFIIFFIFV